MPPFSRSSYGTKNGLISSSIPQHPWSKSRERHSPASQYKTEALKKQSPTRAAAIESKDL